MRILLTGAAGFLGSHLCDRLLSDGHSVIGMDSLITGDTTNLAHLAKNPKFEFVQQDITRSFRISGSLQVVMNFASPASPNPASPYGYPSLAIETLKAGSIGTINTLEIAKDKGAVYLLASTSEIYGDPLEHPQPESYWGHVDSIGLRSMYDESKRFAEAAVMAYHRKYNLDTRIARIFNTYGPRMRLDDGRVVPNLILQGLRQEPLSIFGDGLQTRSFCFVSDLVEGIVRLLLSTETMPINLGNDQETTILDFAQVINRLTNNPSGLAYFPDNRLGGDPQRRRPDLKRARTLLGWEPRVDLEVGLTETINAFRSKLEAA
jgi:dTDP-glucose 4,6-dehydratase